MIIVPIDTAQSSYITMSVNIGDAVVKFRLLWNQRDDSWYCDFKTSSGENDGIRLVPETPLLGPRNRLGVDGDFRVIKVVKTAPNDINYKNLGKDYNLVFATSAEWEEFDGLR